MALNREDAFRLLAEWNQNDSLVKHGLAMEAALRAPASLGRTKRSGGLRGCCMILITNGIPQ